jgi:hypothetical protein
LLAGCWVKDFAIILKRVNLAQSALFLTHGAKLPLGDNCK